MGKASFLEILGLAFQKPTIEITEASAGKILAMPFHVSMEEQIVDKVLFVLIKILQVHMYVNVF